MRRLMLLRHAKSDWASPGLRDHDRPLNPRGREAAAKMGTYMVRHALVPDLIVGGAVIVDPKVVENFTVTHIAQMTGYLAITRLRLALLLNFKHVDLRWKRVVR